MNDELVTVSRKALREVIDGFKEVSNRLEVLAKGETRK